MPDSTRDFFEKVARGGHEPVLEEIVGTIRIELSDEHGIDHVFLEIKNGDLRVSREDRPADCVVHSDRAIFDRMVGGELNAMVAWLRRLFWLEGDARLFRVFMMLFPRSGAAHHPRDFVSYARRSP